MSFMCTRGECPAIVPPLIELKDGHGSRGGDLTEPRSRTTTPKGAAAIGGAAPIPQSRPLGGVHPSPELRAPIRNPGVWAGSADALVLAGVCPAPPGRATSLG